MSKKKKNNIKYSICLISAFLCIFLGEVIKIFYLFAFIFMAIFAFIYASNYENMMETKKEAKIKKIKNNIKLCNCNSDKLSLENLVLKLEKKKFTKTKINGVDFYYKKVVLEPETIILISSVLLIEIQTSIIDEYFAQYKILKKDGPIIYCILIDQNESFLLDELKKVTFSYLEKSLLAQINTLSFNESEDDPFSPRVGMFLYNLKDNLCSYVSYKCMFRYIKKLLLS